jgi:hypothetical protein
LPPKGFCFVELQLYCLSTLILHRGFSPVTGKISVNAALAFNSINLNAEALLFNAFTITRLKHGAKLNLLYSCPNL